MRNAINSPKKEKKSSSIILCFKEKGRGSSFGGMCVIRLVAKGSQEKTRRRVKGIKREPKGLLEREEENLKKAEFAVRE